MEETVKMQEEPVVLQEETPAVSPETDELAELAAEPTVEPVGAAEQPAPEEPTLSHTAALERELEQLRQEKLRRQLMDEASAQLTERGIDPAFAPFVLGETSADTRKRVEQFDRQFAAALRRHLAARLPAGEPRDFSVSRPAPRRRGIRKLN